MKNLKIILFSLVAAGFILSCSSDDGSNENNNNNNNNNNDPNPQFAMTYKINGVQHNRNNTFGTNEAINNIFTYYPDEEFIRLQGNNGIMSDGYEINLMIRRSDLALGTYQVNDQTDETTTHIDLINNNNTENESTREGSITITSINTTTKRVKGTFHFKTSDSWHDVPYTVNYDITDGTFDYRYDVEE